MALLPYHVPGLLFAVLEWGVAVALLALNPRHRGSRAFALLVTLRGMTTSLVMLGGQGVPPVLDDPAQVELARRLFPYAAMSLFPATLYFLAVYLRAPGGARRAGWLAPLALALAGAQEALYLLDHSLWFGAGTAAVPVGPLTALVPLNRAGYVVAAILFLREARRAPAGPRRSAFLAMSAGFGIFPLVGLLAFGAFGVVAGRPPAFLAAYAVAAGLAAGLLARLARSALADADAGLRRAARRYLVALALFAATLLPVAGLPPGTDRETTLTLLSGLWLLPQPLLCAYALLRHQLFDIDLKVKWTIKQSTVAGMFIGVFFIVSEGAQQVFSASIGPVLGIVAAGALLFALAPLQHAAERVANAALPGARPLGDLGRQDRAAVYRDQVLYAWQDGVLTDDERGLLEHLRHRLGLSVEEAARIEHDVTTARLAARARGDAAT